MSAPSTFLAAYFSPDYATARSRFRAGAEARGFRLEAHPIGAVGPNGEELTIDVALGGDARATGVVVVSSGLHGVEGPFGAAVQLALLNSPAPLPSGVALVLLHALNPFGFAWVRRPNEENADLNRNFLSDGTSYRGSPPLYAALDRLLNPKHPLRRLDGFLFRFQALLAILRYGMPALKQAVAGGQYDFPCGIFFGGQQPSRTYHLLAEHLPRWIGDAATILHLDFHTGLGHWGTYQLLLDAGIGPAQFDWLRAHFGDQVQRSDPARSIAYETRGDLGAWCRATFPDRTYELLCAEFGTYPPLRVLSALRAENQAHFWGVPDAPATRSAKRRLMEAFVPASLLWRDQSVVEGLDIISRAVVACSGAKDPARHL